MQVAGEILPWMTVRAGVGALPLSVSYTYRNAELGLMYQESPTVTSGNAVLNELTDRASEIDDLNRFLDHYFRFYPVLKFNLVYRLF